MESGVYSQELLKTQPTAKAERLEAFLMPLVLCDNACIQKYVGKHGVKNDPWLVRIEWSAPAREKEREPEIMRYGEVYFKFLSPKPSSFKTDSESSLANACLSMASSESALESIFLFLFVSAWPGYLLT